jgi:hypothetical protein
VDTEDCWRISTPPTYRRSEKDATPDSRIVAAAAAGSRLLLWLPAVPDQKSRTVPYRVATPAPVFVVAIASYAQPRGCAIVVSMPTLIFVHGACVRDAAW